MLAVVLLTACSQASPQREWIDAANAKADEGDILLELDADDRTIIVAKYTGSGIAEVFAPLADAGLDTSSGRALFCRMAVTAMGVPDEHFSAVHFSDESGATVDCDVAAANSKPDEPKDEE